MTLYNLKSALDDYRITKFDRDLNMESSYIIGYDERGSIICECPAGTRPTCRHRQMLGDLIPLVDTEWFLDFETGRIVDANGKDRPWASVAEAEPISAMAVAQPQTGSWRRI